MNPGGGETAFAILMRRLAERAAALSPREKLLVAAMGGLLLVAVGFGITGGLRAYQADVAARLKAERDSLAELRALGPQALRAGGAPRTLAATLEDLLARSGVRDRVQLNPVTQATGSRVQAMEIKAEQLTLDEMVRLVYLMEGPDVPLVIDQFDVAPSFRDKELLRVSLRVLGQG